MGLLIQVSARRCLCLGMSLLALWQAAACAGSQKTTAAVEGDDVSGPPPPCGKDEVREYLCDDLLPLNSEQPAPEPYQTCPSSVGVKGSVFPATSSWARFDIQRTDWTRKRAPPGHACCYSWCSTLKVADASDVDAASCGQPNAMRERLCVSGAERSVSRAASSPNEQCAEAITPPAGVAFAPPRAAALDLQATAERRSQGLTECCYGWCSRAPLGTGLGAR